MSFTLPSFSMVGGSVADSYQFPSVVKFLFKKQNEKRFFRTHGCTGTFISENFILTAKHCVQNWHSIKIESFDYSDSIKSPIVIKHPSLDIALVRTNKKSNHFAELDFSKAEEGTSVLLVGYGIEFKKHISDFGILRFGYQRLDYDSYGEMVMGSSKNIYCEIGLSPKENRRIWPRDSEGELIAMANHGDSGGPVFLRENFEKKGTLVINGVMRAGFFGHTFAIPLYQIEGFIHKTLLNE